MYTSYFRIRAKVIGIALAATIAATGLGAGTALAQSPHFVGTPSCSKSINTGLTCSGKAAGLANAPTAAFLTADSVTADYVCVNKGGNAAPGQPVVIQDVTGPTDQITPHSGQITFSSDLPVPAPPSSKVECPNAHWRVVLISLTYVNVVLHIEQNGTDILSLSFGTIDP